MNTELKPIPISERDAQRPDPWADRGHDRGQDRGQDCAATDPQAAKVLRSTYLLLALTMVPTLIGALIGMATSGIVTAAPIVASIVMLAVVVGLQFAIAANRNSGAGIALLLLMTGVLGWWLGPILNVALSTTRGGALVAYAAAGTGAIVRSAA